MGMPNFRMASDDERAAVASLLGTLRREAGLTQRQLARKLGRSQNWICQRERTGGARVDPAEFVAWCHACGVDPETAFSRLLARHQP